METAYYEAPIQAFVVTGQDTILGELVDCIAQIIKCSKQARRKAICFVTGVPSAGKTLAG